MTFGGTKTFDRTTRSVGEERLVAYLRVCNYVFYLGLAPGAAGFAWGNVHVLGLGVAFVTGAAAAKFAGVIIAYLVMSTRTPNAEIAPWIRRWTRTASVLATLAAVFALVAGQDFATRLIAVFTGVLSVLLFRRVGRLTIAELGEGLGPTGYGSVFRFSWFSPEIDVWLAGAWLALAIFVRVSMPSLFRPSEQKVHPDQLKMRVLAVVNAESRYHREHGRYSSDIVELRRLGSSLIDSLVSVTADDRSYRAVARDPGGRVSCGLWSAARIGERTPLQIEGAAAGQLVCWTPSDSAKKAAR
jgi:hypothetical protein